MWGSERQVNGDHRQLESEPTYGSFVCSGVRIDEIDPQVAIEILRGSRYGKPRRTHLCNAYTLSLALRDVGYRELLNASDFNFADGHYVAMVGRWRGRKVMNERVYGPTLMLRTIDAGRSVGLKHYLYGATPQTAEQLATSLQDRYPEVAIVGVESPPFRPLTPDEEEALFARVREAKPDIFWVGLGTPRQDAFVAQYSQRLACTVVPVGAAFDFHSGNKPIAPPIAQKLGMEWAFRLATEPIRLWRRYIFGIPIFVVGVATDPWFRSRQAKTVAVPLPVLKPPEATNRRPRPELPVRFVDSATRHWTIPHGRHPDADVLSNSK